MCWWAVFFYAGTLYHPGPVLSIFLATLLFLILHPGLFRPFGSMGLKSSHNSTDFPKVRAVLVCVTGLLVMMSSGNVRRPDRKGEGSKDGNKGLETVVIEKSGSAGSVRIDKIVCSIRSFPASVRKWIEHRVDDHTLTRRSKGLMKAFILADRRSVGRGLIDDYAHVGIAHFLALSGLHLGIMTVALSVLIKRPFGTGWIAEIPLMVFLVVYTLAAGSPPSLVRALALMMTFRFSAALGLRLSLGQALLTGSFILLSFMPALLYSVGFQLSFLAVAGIAGLGLPSLELIRRRFSPGRFISAILSLVIITLSVQFYTMPLSLERFGRVPVLAASANILMSLPVVLMLYLSMAHIAIPFQWIRELVSIPLNLVSEILWRTPEKILFLGNPCILRGEVEYFTYIVSIGVLSISLRRARSRQIRMVMISASLLVLSFLLAEGCYGLRSGSDRFEDDNEKISILEGDPVIVIVAGRLNRFDAACTLKRMWEEGHRTAGYLVICSCDEREVRGLSYLTVRTGMPEVICSPYLDQGKRADIEGKMTIDNGIYTVKISIPHFPPEPGSIVNAAEAGLKYRIRKK